MRRSFNNTGDSAALIAIVAEGGGQRGIYTAGILDQFLQHNFNPFTVGIGVSAGAQNLLAFFLGENGYARRAITELTMAPSFFVPYRWLMAQSIIDLDTYFESSLHDPDYRLPYQRIDAVQQKRQLYFVATSREALNPVYLEPDAQNVVNYLKASSAVPFLYKAGVPFGDQVLIDGGIGDPLPVRKAYTLGARKILVIRTDAPTSDLSSWRERLDTTGFRRVLPSSVKHMLEIHENAFADARQFMENPPDDVQIVQIAPKETLQSQAFGSRSSALLADYNSGLTAAAQILPVLQHWTSQSTVESAPG